MVNCGSGLILCCRLLAHYLNCKVAARATNEFVHEIWVNELETVANGVPLANHRMNRHRPHGRVLPSCSPFSIYSRVRSVDFRISTIATRPPPSFRGIRRWEMMAWKLFANRLRMVYCSASVSATATACSLPAVAFPNHFLEASRPAISSATVPVPGATSQLLHPFHPVDPRSKLRTQQTRIGSFVREPANSRELLVYGIGGQTA